VVCIREEVFPYERVYPERALFGKRPISWELLENPFEIAISHSPDLSLFKKERLVVWIVVVMAICSQELRISNLKFSASIDERSVIRGAGSVESVIRYTPQLIRSTLLVGDMRIRLLIRPGRY